MPLLVQHIDAIAREKNRDVLFLHFENYIEDQELEDNARDRVLAWLDKHQIAYTPCMGIENENVISSYLGDVYLEVAFDEEDPNYQILHDHLEDEEGNMKIEGVFFYVLLLETALEIEAERGDDFDFGFDEQDQDVKPRLS
jgi:hypothetical protein